MSKAESLLPFDMPMPHQRGDWPPNYESVFWNAYPNRIAKGAAMKSLARLRKDGVSFAEIMAGLDRYKVWLRGPGWRPDAKHPATWLNASCWMDELQHTVEGSNGNFRKNGCENIGYAGIAAAIRARRSSRTD